MGENKIIIPGDEVDLKKLTAPAQGGKPADPWSGLIAQAATAAANSPALKLTDEFLIAIETLPMQAAELWATVMENSVRSATIDFSWKDPLDATGKKVLTDSHDIPNGVLDGGQKLADRIAAVGKSVAGAKILIPEQGQKAIAEMSRLIAEVGEFLKQNPGKGEGASWKFDLVTPFDARVAKIAEVDLPEARGYLITLFNDMMKIIETVDINLKKPNYGDNHRQFVQSGMAKIYGSESGEIAVATTLMGLPRIAHD